MKICLLCKKAPATQLNSHIIPWGLIKESISINEQKKRGYDFTYSIPTSSSPNLFYGRNVIPESIEELLGSKFTTDGITDKDPFTYDNILCPSCEKKIGIVENNYFSKVYQNLKSHSNNSAEFDSKGNKIHYTINNNAIISKLFIISLFFRASIVNFNNHSLSKSFELKLKDILNTYLSLPNDELIKLKKPITSDFNSITTLSVYLSSNENDSVKNNIITFNHSTQPFFLWCDKVAYMLFEKPSHIQNVQDYFFGFSNYINYRECSTNSSDKEKIIFFDGNKRNKILQNCVEYIAESSMKNSKILFRKMYKHFFKKNPTLKVINLFAYHYSIEHTSKLYSDLNEPFINAFSKTLGLNS